MNIKIDPGNIFRFLFICISILTLLNVVVQVINYLLDYPNNGLLNLFDVNIERSIPTFCQGIFLVVTSFLLGLITLDKSREVKKRNLWLGLTVIFLYLAADELICFHERAGHLLASTLHVEELWLHPWVIVYLPFIVLFIAMYWSFFKEMDRKHRSLFLISGAVYLSGSLGLEMICKWVNKDNGIYNVTYSIFITIEEFLEMFGLALLIYTLLVYIKTEIKLISFDFKS